jgi:hypothetical protein
MADPAAKPSSAVTAAAIIAILGSAFAVLGVLMGVFGLLLVSRLPQGPALPAGVLPVATAMMIGFLALAVLGIFTGIGLLRLRNWARISALVWAGISAPCCALVLLVFMLIPMPAPPNGPPAVMYFVRIFSLLFYGVPLAVGIWWLVLFNTKAVAAQFTGPTVGSEATATGILSEPAAPGPPGLPLPITVLAWFFLLSCLSFGFILMMPMRTPALLFGVAIRGAAGVGVYVTWCLVITATGIGLLKRMRWSYTLAIGLQIFGFVNGIVTVMNPRYEAIMREAISSASFQTRQAYPIPGMEHLRVFAYFGLAIPLAVLWLLVYYRPQFLEASAARSGLVMTP